MSHPDNEQLFERAKYVSDEYVGTYLPQAIDRLIEQGDLEALEYMVREAEFALAAGEDAYPGTRVELEQTDAY